MNFVVRSPEQLAKDFDLASLNHSIELGRRLSRNESILYAMQDYVEKLKKVRKIK